MKTPAGIDPTLCPDRQILAWISQEEERQERPITAPEVAAAFGDVTNSLQPRLTVLTRALLLYRVRGVVNPLSGVSCYGYRRTENFYDAGDVARAAGDVESKPFTWRGFERHFCELSDDDAEALIDKINALAEKRWAPV